jgi:hypothetical protein
MVAPTQQKPSRRSDQAWQDRFLQMLPTIHQHARLRFRRLTPELRAECVQEAICNACCAVARAEPGPRWTATQQVGNGAFTQWC